MHSLNPYWPVFRSVENEVLRLMDNIHFLPDQYGVYSIKIGSILLQTVSEIESISKDLYATETGEKKDGIHFDHVALKYLDRAWRLRHKIVDISTFLFHGANTDRKLIPFQKFSSPNAKSNWGWNDAYQSLKHNRIDNIYKGNIGNLLQAAGALFLLNVYFAEDEIELGDDGEGTGFRNDRGSELFSIRSVSVGTGFNQAGKFYVINDVDIFDKSTYVIVPTVATFEKQAAELGKLASTVNRDVNERVKRRLVQEIESRRVGARSLAEFQNLIQDIQNSESDKVNIEKIFADNPQAYESARQLIQNNEYQAVLNKHNLPTS